MRVWNKEEEENLNKAEDASRGRSQGFAEKVTVFWFFFDFSQHQPNIGWPRGEKFVLFFLFLLFFFFFSRDLPKHLLLLLQTLFF